MTRSQARSSLVFLFSNATEIPDRFFQGYFFHGTDYVFGARGFDAFCEARGRFRPDREDGCYVHVEKQDDGSYRFSADYNGYKKLFYFRNGGFWAVSNSLDGMCAHLRRHGHEVSPDRSQLSAMASEGTFYPSGRGSFFSQPTSFDTIVRGIRLVPADCALRIGSAGVCIERARRRDTNDGYPQRLARFTGTWIGRLRTLVNEPSVQISCDLTGGLDSRVVLALLLAATRDCDPSVRERLQVLSDAGRRARRDHAVATELCERFGLALNGRPGGRPTWLNGRASYALWKDLCLGVYHPIYFPNTFPSGDLVRLGGGGGENHRPFYGRFVGAPSADTFVSRRTRNIFPRSARAGFAAALQQAIDDITEGSPGHLDALACHYRHFRNRFHAGREPQYGVKLQPLASKGLDSVAAVAGTSRFHSAQMLYDLLYNLNPELLEVPFDDWRKRPGRGVRRDVTPAAACPGPPGTCFVENTRASPADVRSRRTTTRAVDCLLDEFQRATAGFATDFLGSAYVRRATRALRAAAQPGQFSSTTQSKRVAVVMACALFDEG